MPARPPLGRRFRALKLWFVIRYYGLEGLRAHIRRGVAMAQEVMSWVEDASELAGMDGWLGKAVAALVAAMVHA